MRLAKRTDNIFSDDFGRVGDRISKTLTVRPYKARSKTEPARKFDIPYVNAAFPVLLFCYSHRCRCFFIGFSVDALPRLLVLVP